MSGLQQGGQRPVRLLSAASPVQEDLQPPGQQSPQEEFAEFVRCISKQRSEELQHSQQCSNVVRQQGR